MKWFLSKITAIMLLSVLLSAPLQAQTRLKPASGKVKVEVTDGVVMGRPGLGTEKRRHVYDNQGREVELDCFYRAGTDKVLDMDDFLYFRLDGTIKEEKNCTQLRTQWIRCAQDGVRVIEVKTFDHQDKTWKCLSFNPANGTETTVTYEADGKTVVCRSTEYSCLAFDLKYLSLYEDGKASLLLGSGNFIRTDGTLQLRVEQKGPAAQDEYFYNQAGQLEYLRCYSGNSMTITAYKNYAAYKQYYQLEPCMLRSHYVSGRMIYHYFLTSVEELDGDGHILVKHVMYPNGRTVKEDHEYGYDGDRPPADRYFRTDGTLEHETIYCETQDGLRKSLGTRYFPRAENIGPDFIPSHLLIPQIDDPRPRHG